MSQVRTIDGSTTTPLRSLPLPGRDGIGPADDVRLKAAQQAQEQSQTNFDAARALAEQSNETAAPVAVSYTGQTQQTAASSAPAASQTSTTANSGGVNVSDDVLRFLLTANEVDQNNDGGGQSLQSYGGLTRSGGGLNSYQDVASAFPRTQSSLFSLAA